MLIETLPARPPAALDRGINFIDTADTYSYGEAEQIFGKAMASTRPVESETD